MKIGKYLEINQVLSALNKTTKYAIDSTLFIKWTANTKLDNIFSQLRMTAKQDKAFVGTGDEIYHVQLQIFILIYHTAEDFQHMYIIEATKGMEKVSVTSLFPNG